MIEYIIISHHLFSFKLLFIGSPQSVESTPFFGIVYIMNETAERRLLLSSYCFDEWQEETSSRRLHKSCRIYYHRVIFSLERSRNDSCDRLRERGQHPNLQGSGSHDLSNRQIFPSWRKVQFVGHSYASLFVIQQDEGSINQNSAKGVRGGAWAGLAKYQSLQVGT